MDRASLAAGHRHGGDAIQRHRISWPKRQPAPIVPRLRPLFAAYGIRAPMPDLAGSYSGERLIICGDAACVWDDLDKFSCRDEIGKGGVKKPEYDFMVVNKLGETFPGDIEHWYSNAPHLLHAFERARRSEYAKEFSITHTHSCQPGAMWHWPWNAQGTSGLGAVVVGVGLGYDRIVLCGMPLDDGPHNGEPPWRKTKFANSEVTDFDCHWDRAVECFGGLVFSLSGRTREWFGPPPP